MEQFGIFLPNCLLKAPIHDIFVSYFVFQYYRLLGVFSIYLQRNKNDEYIFVSAIHPRLKFEIQ